MSIYLWLDDRRPVPPGWTGAKTVAEAQAILATGRVKHASLDHDLGACEPCMDIYRADPRGVMPNCEHFGTGWTLVQWMIETGHWPKNRPTVHSLNPDGGERMRAAIARYFPGERE